MDQKCKVCTHTTDDSTGKCRFCGTPFPVAKDKAPEKGKEDDPAGE